MSQVQIVTGKDQIVTVQLKRKGVDDIAAQPFVIDPGATVRAVLVSTDHKTKYGQVIACSSSTAGADWSTSLVAIEFTGTDTAAFTDFGRKLIEIEVTESGVDSPFFAPVQLVKGHIL